MNNKQHWERLFILIMGAFTVAGIIVISFIIKLIRVISKLL